mmetsp:Transcript_4893/g.9195  ORF Transcript_4893/g.9195 Transcript_4893/m.9195 type:complete len:311 (-) Transcript_4893:6-938(-)
MIYCTVTIYLLLTKLPPLTCLRCILRLHLSLYPAAQVGPQHTTGDDKKLNSGLEHKPRGVVVIRMEKRQPRVSCKLLHGRPHAENGVSLRPQHEVVASQHPAALQLRPPCMNVLHYPLVVVQCINVNDIHRIIQYHRSRAHTGIANDGRSVSKRGHVVESLRQHCFVHIIVRTVGDVHVSAALHRLPRVHHHISPSSPLFQHETRVVPPVHANLHKRAPSSSKHIKRVTKHISTVYLRGHRVQKKGCLAADRHRGLPSVAVHYSAGDEEARDTLRQGADTAVANRYSHPLLRQACIIISVRRSGQAVLCH